MSQPAVREERYCTFYLGDARYGIDILTVREINRRAVVTPTYGAADCVRGLMNLRGQIVTVIDPALRLGGRPHEFSRATRLVILKTNAELEASQARGRATSEDLAGLCVDRISDVIEVSEEQIAPPPPDRQGKGETLISGIAQLEDGVIRILNPTAMLNLGEGD
jgi:purine-binding chemotaxis protein CheW